VSSIINDDDIIADNHVDSIMQEGMTFTIGMHFAVIFITEVSMLMQMFDYLPVLNCLVITYTSQISQYSENHFSESYIWVQKKNIFEAHTIDAELI